MAVLSVVLGFAALASDCRLLLVRHGETNYNADGRIQGRLESILTDKGHQQARDLGKWLAAAEQHVDRVFVSPRRRTRQTLAEIEEYASSLPPAEVHAGLREIELTMWEGQNRKDLRGADGRSDADRWAYWKADPDRFVFEEDGHSPLGDLKDRCVRGSPLHYQHDDSFC